jgi:hypothetical protein
MDMAHGRLQVSPVTTPTCKTKDDFHASARSHLGFDTLEWAKRNGAKGPVFYLAEREGPSPPPKQGLVHLAQSRRSAHLLVQGTHFCGDTTCP